jgi:hypothetical protein
MKRWNQHRTWECRGMNHENPSLPPGHVKGSYYQLPPASLPCTELCIIAFLREDGGWKEGIRSLSCKGESVAYYLFTTPLVLPVL